MLGTLAGALDVRQVAVLPENIEATVDGINEIIDGMPLLTEIRIAYTLRIPAGSREVVDRALAKHQLKCPSAQSFKDSVKIGWSAEIEELPA